ncbi:MAG: hypothetical protein UY81_C0042G0007, partial [Candidatus Giovannonibacteria bacterium GW2011_GWA2_53_7]
MRDILRPLAAHLFAVLAVVMIATALGRMGAQEKLSIPTLPHEQLASGAASESTANSAVFAVVVTEDVFCQNDVPMTTIGFLAVPPDGGMFHLVSANGLDVPFISGSYPLANGNYSWYAVPTPGLTATGPTTGVLALSGECNGRTSSLLGSEASSPASSGSVYDTPVVTTTATTTATSSFPITPPQPPAVDTPALSRPVLKLFQDDTPLVDGSEAKGVLELRVSDSDVKSVDFVSLRTEGVRTLLGKGALDDLLSDEDYTTWVYF